jgi:hypothetical protein
MPEIRTYSEVLMHLDDRPRSYAAGQVIFEDCEPAAEMFIWQRPLARRTARPFDERPRPR